MPRISNLPSNTRAAGPDELPSVDVDESTTKKITVQMVMPTGTILDYAGQAAPAGFLLCHGQALNAQLNPEYNDLYTAIGNTYGGTSNLDFVVPDLRGRVVAGQDDMGGTSANRLTGLSGGVDGDVMGGTGGAQSHTLTLGQLATHRHAVRGDTRSDTVGFQFGGNGGSVANMAQAVSHVNNATYTGVLTAWDAGGNEAHNNVQPTIILNKIIKY